MVAGSVPLPEACELVGDSLVEPSATVSGSLEASAIGARSQLDHGAVAKRSAIWCDVELCEGSIVEDSIVCDGVRIPPGSSFSRSLVMKNEPDLEVPEGAKRVGDLIVVPI